MTDELLAEQVRYYRARANEYDETSPYHVHPYSGIVARIADDLRALGPVDRVIELGAGTGQFTGAIASIAQRVIAVDASPETLEVLRAKVDAPNVETVVADVFDYAPDYRPTSSCSAPCSRTSRPSASTRSGRPSTGARAGRPGLPHRQAPHEL